MSATNCMDCVYTKYLDYLKMWSGSSDITPQLTLRFIFRHPGYV